MAYRALYLRYRPKKFSEVKGQEHTVKAIQTSVREDRVGHAYLLHGPRGTGKTTIARLLAKALNCTELGNDGEPCCTCESCVAFEKNRSFDLHELDAASNNKVDDMRALLERVSLVTPGRAKVYLLDEVHMLTPGAENALLKTLEEPPDHVTWVMATTEPHKVAETIRSRCQVFELGLLNADLMGEHVRYVVADAELDVDDDVVDYVISVGAGSVRDTLSALDSVTPGMEVDTLGSPIDNIVTAIGDHNPAAALTAIDDAIKRGNSPRTIGKSLLNHLRDGFLAKMGVIPPRLSEQHKIRARKIAAQFTAAEITQPLETLGRVLVEMRQAPDPRVDIEVALVKICSSKPENPTETLKKRVDQLESQFQQLSTRLSQLDKQPKPKVPAPFVPRIPPAPAKPSPVPTSTPTPTSAPATPTSPVDPIETSTHTPTSTPEPIVDPIELEPETPSQVVQLAETYLDLDKETVIAEAKKMLPKKEQGRQHDPKDLLRLWKHLINKTSKNEDPRNENEDSAISTQEQTPDKTTDNNPDLSVKTSSSDSSEEKPREENPKTENISSDNTTNQQPPNLVYEENPTTENIFSDNTTRTATASSSDIEKTIARVFPGTLFINKADEST